MSIKIILHTTVPFLMGLTLATVTQAATPPTPSSLAAAITTANNSADCKAVAPFYWEIGNKEGPLASGSTGNGSVTASSLMLMASASKWIFGAYAVQVRNGVLSHEDIASLNMTSPYHHLRYKACVPLMPSRKDKETVAECFHRFGNNRVDPKDSGKFYYNGAHFQAYATLDLGLGNMDRQSLGARVNDTLGLSIAYDSPQMAAGIITTPQAYASFLKRMLTGQIILGRLLGAHAVCTNPKTCSQALFTPIPANESWHYSLGHWVEDDPNVGDGAFSSPGAFGFYPWIDKSKTYYGLLAREDHHVLQDPANKSVLCGRAIRKAWLIGFPQ